jgi:hypothetical protein
MGIRSRDSPGVMKPGLLVIADDRLQDDVGVSFREQTSVELAESVLTVWSTVALPSASSLLEGSFTAFNRSSCL